MLKKIKGFWLKNAKFNLQACYLLIGLFLKKNMPLHLLEVSCPKNAPFSLKYMLSRKKKKNQNIILIFHSLNGDGNNDKRVQQLANVISKLGYDVYLPHFSMTANRLIHPESLSHIIYFLTWFSKSIQKPFSIIAPCLDGTLCLEAITEETIKPMVNSICCIGSSHSFVQIVRMALEYPPEDPFALLVIYHVLLHQTNELTPNLFQAFSTLFIRIEANESLSDEDIQHLSSQEKKLIKTALSPTKIKRHCSKLKKEIEALEIRPKLNLVTTPVCLLHGHKDPVIPTECIHELVKGLMTAPHYAAITHLLDHGNVQLSTKIVREVITIVKALSFFFKHASLGPSSCGS